MTTVKRIIHYVNGTFDYGIWYSRDSNDCLAGYSDVIRPGVLTIEKAPRVVASTSKIIWCLG